MRAQEPTIDGHLEWREVTTNKRYWTVDAAERYTDPSKRLKRLEERRQRKVFRLLGAGCRVEGVRCRVQGVGFGDQCLGSRV